MKRQHLLPLTNENANRQYAIVQPIRIFFAERCICSLLTRNWVVLSDFREIKEIRVKGDVAYSLH